MNRIVSNLTLAAAAAFGLLGLAGLAGCATNDGGGGANEPVIHTNEIAVDPSSLAAGKNTQHHFQDPSAGTGVNGITDPTTVLATNQTIGSPEVVARLHSCGKVPYASLGNLLASRGVNIMPDSAGAPTAGTLYSQGAAALGTADYAGRVAEMVVASTSAMAKEFDIFVAASTEIQTNLTNSSACPGTTMIDSTGSFTVEGVSCLLGKPALPAHVTLANQLVQAAPDTNTGIQLAIATLLEAAHTCE